VNSPEFKPQTPLLLPPPQKTTNNRVGKSGVVKSGVVVHDCNPGYKRSIGRRTTVSGQPRQKVRPRLYLKSTLKEKKKKKRIRGMTQVAESLSSKCMVLSSNSSTENIHTHKNWC
jgi:hypothetical protein